MPVLLTVLLVVIALLVVGSLVVGLAVKLLWWALVGVVIGALGRLALPGEQPIGVLPTAGAGIGGSLAGGIVADAAGWGSVVQFLLAIALAAGIVALLAGRASGQERHPARV